MFQQRVECVRHVPVAQIPRRLATAIAHAIILFGILHNAGVLQRREPFLPLRFLRLMQPLQLFETVPVPVAAAIVRAYGRNPIHLGFIAKAGKALITFASARRHLWLGAFKMLHNCVVEPGRLYRSMP
jgi:hypothetical protein